uniref:Uncharacterized protein n=1 Tax=Parascaris equorum TaxID=6256 RepID=A0A914RDV6_PAREQ
MIDIYLMYATKNEAPATDFGSLFVILVLCLFFCFAVRHFNDFYTGDTVISIIIFC